MKCECGRRMSKYARECKQCAQQRLDTAYEEAGRIVATGRCPQCGGELRRNLALAGWWQCRQYGADTHRQYVDRPSCSFQTFTGEGQ